MFEELELLRNVYFEQLELSEEDSGEVQLKFHVTPSTADDKDRQYVYLDLEITLTDMVGLGVTGPSPSSFVLKPLNVKVSANVYSI